MMLKIINSALLLASAILGHPTDQPYTTNAVVPTTDAPSPVTTVSPGPVRPSSYTNLAVYMEYNLNWNNVESDIQQALGWGYNTFYVGFYMSLYGCQGGCGEWINMDDTRRQNIKQMLQTAGAKLILAVGGPGEFIEGVGNADAWGQDAASFAKQYSFDGLDFAIALAGEPTPTYPSSYIGNNFFINVAQSLATAGHNAGFSRSQMTISSHAPYFSAQYCNNNVKQSLSWLALEQNKDQPWAVQFVNLDMINEADHYMSFNDIFIQNSYTAYAGSAVSEVAALGIDLSNIAVIKPLTEDLGTVRTDWVSSSQLAQWGCQFSSAPYYGWGGFTMWTWELPTTQQVTVYGQALDLSQC